MKRRDPANYDYSPPPPQVEELLRRYDFALAEENTDGTIVRSVGMRVDWSSPDVQPFVTQLEEQSPPPSMSGADGEELYTGRDLSDYWRIIFRQFHGGGGQYNRDVEGGVASKFYDSRNIDSSREDGVRLAHREKVVDQAGLTGQAIEHAGRIAFARTPAASGNGYRQVGFWDGTTTTYANGITDDDPVSAMASDGEYLYIALTSDDGQTGGIWKGKDNGQNFTKLPDSQPGITAMVFCTGYLYGTTGINVGTIDVTSGLFTSRVLQGAVASVRTTFGLAQIGSWVYWGITAGARSWVYALRYRPDSNPEFEEYLTLPTGFVGTTLCGYLGDLFTGGYYLSRHGDTEQGAVYIGTQSGAARLCVIGPDPNEIDSGDILPGDSNRVTGIVAYDDYLWITTIGDLYRWNLRHGGLTHTAEIGIFAATPDGQQPAEPFSWLTAPDSQIEYVVNEESDSSPNYRPNSTQLASLGWMQNSSYSGEEGGREEFEETTGDYEHPTLDAPLRIHTAFHKVLAAQDPPAPSLEMGENSPFTLRAQARATPFPDDAYVIGSSYRGRPERQGVVWALPAHALGQAGPYDNSVGTTFEVGTARLWGRCAELGIRDGTREGVVRLMGGREEESSIFRFSLDSWTLQIGEYGTDWSFRRIRFASGRQKPHLIRLTLKDDLFSVYVDGKLVGETRQTRSTTGFLDGETVQGCYVCAGWPLHPNPGTVDILDEDKAPYWCLDLVSLRVALTGSWGSGSEIYSGGCGLSSFAVLYGMPWLPVDESEQSGLLSLDPVLYADEGELVTSFSSSKMPDMVKRFSYVDVYHEPILGDERMEVEIETDSSEDNELIAIPHPVYTSGSSTLVPWSGSGRRARVRMRLFSSSDHKVSPRPVAVTLRYGLPDIVRYQLLIDLREGVRTLTDEKVNTKVIYEFLRYATDNGLQMRFYWHGGSTRVRPELFQFSKARMSIDDTHLPQGLATLRLRKV